MFELGPLFEDRFINCLSYRIGAMSGFRPVRHVTGAAQMGAGEGYIRLVGNTVEWAGR